MLLYVWAHYGQPIRDVSGVKSEAMLTFRYTTF